MITRTSVDFWINSRKIGGEIQNPHVEAWGLLSHGGHLLHM